MAQTYEIYTDGSFRVSRCGKHRYGAWAAVVLQDDRVIREMSGFEWNTTINRMELMAIIKSLADLPDGSTVILYSDSTYSVNSVNFWIERWANNNWKTAGDKDVLNQDLMEKIRALKKKLRVSARWVKSHNTDMTDRNTRYNTKVDAMAQALTIRMASGELVESGKTAIIPTAPIPSRPDERRVGFKNQSPKDSANYPGYQTVGTFCPPPGRVTVSSSVPKLQPVPFFSAKEKRGPGRPRKTLAERHKERRPKAELPF